MNLKKKKCFCGTETKDLILEDQNGCIKGSQKFKYLGRGVKIDKEDRQENYNNRINKGRAIIAMLNGVLWNEQITRKKTNNKPIT